MRHAIVVGCGNLLRGDDGVGILAARLLRERLRLAGNGTRWPGWRLAVVEAGESGVELLDLLAGTDLALIVDAIAEGAAPGTIHRRDAGVVSGAGRRAAGALSSHGAGLATALALGRALLPEQWPGTIAIWGIEPASVRFGDELSPPVAAALPELVARVHGELEATLAISCSVAEVSDKPMA